MAPEFCGAARGGKAGNVPPSRPCERPNGPELIELSAIQIVSADYAELQACNHSGELIGVAAGFVYIRIDQELFQVKTEETA
jgi:hypothetical protein